jgi:hypothetical protein
MFAQSELARKPSPDRLRHRRGSTEAVVARYEDDRAQLRGRRDPERIALALNDEHRYRDRV